MKKLFRIEEVGPRDAYRYNSVVGLQVLVEEGALAEWEDGWMYGPVTWADTQEDTNFHQVKLVAVEDSLGTIKETVMKRDGCSSDEFDLMLEGAIEDFDNGDSPEEILADWFGLEPDYVMEFLEIAAGSSIY